MTQGLSPFGKKEDKLVVKKKKENLGSSPTKIAGKLT
jgi:hypothetical protein